MSRELKALVAIAFVVAGIIITATVDWRLAVATSLIGWAENIKDSLRR